MSILVDRETRLLVQGITGREGEFHSRAMLEYGTNIVAGMTPGKGGQTALDGRVPVFDTVADAVRETGANTSCIFVPAAVGPGRHPRGGRCAASASSSASPRASRRSTCSRVYHVLRAKGVRLIGPNCPGADRRSGEAKVGIIPGDIHRPGPVGLVSRSGHAHLRGRAGDDRCRHGPVDLRRHRRRPDRRHELHRRARRCSTRIRRPRRS